MEIIKYLAEVLAQNINISSTATRGLIKLAIRDQLGPFYQFSQITYDDLKKTIQEALRNRLKVLKIQNFEDLTSFLLKELKLNQSLITMSRL
ncbi:MAG: hypothetical protein JW891_13960 [Candidatus Lokiarchaeota archaeon]|nr:hypothetical protein [Candidatus Lokiarchaeota archaeon]